MKHWHKLSGIIKTSYLAKWLSSPVFTMKKKKNQSKTKIDKTWLQNLYFPNGGKFGSLFPHSSSNANFGLLIDSINLICFQLSSFKYNWCQENKCYRAGTILLQLRDHLGPLHYKHIEISDDIKEKPEMPYEECANDYNNKR